MDEMTTFKPEPSEIDWTAIDGWRLPQMLGDDAAAWAVAFCQHAKKYGDADIEESWMIGWFANAIEAAHDARVRRMQPETKPVVTYRLFKTDD